MGRSLMLRHLSSVAEATISSIALLVVLVRPYVMPVLVRPHTCVQARKRRQPPPNEESEAFSYPARQVPNERLATPRQGKSLSDYP